MNTAAEAIRALSLQVPGFRRQMNEGWYQIRIAGDDTAPEAVYARLHEQLGEGTVIHIVPRLAGAGKGGLQIVLGAAAIVGSFFTAGATMALWGSALAAGGFSATTMLFSLGASMILGGVAQMLAPKAKTPDYRATDNGRQNTYFSSLDNMIAQGNPMPVPYGEMLVGSRRISQDISTRDEGGAERSWLSGGRHKSEKIPQCSRTGTAGALRRLSVRNYSYVTTKTLTQRGRMCRSFQGERIYRPEE